MGPLLTQRRGVDVRAVTVRPTFGAQEHRHWDRLVAAHHYLGFRGLFGRGLRHVATWGSSWVALVGWQAAALKLTARDRWIGWTLEQQLRRLHLVAQNSCFVILPDFQGVPNLAPLRSAPSLRGAPPPGLTAGCSVPVHGLPDTPRRRRTRPSSGSWRAPTRSRWSG